MDINDFVNKLLNRKDEEQPEIVAESEVEKALELAVEDSTPDKPGRAQNLRKDDLDKGGWYIP